MSSRNDNVVRPLPNFSPSLWGDLFISSFVVEKQVSEAYAVEVEKLKEDVRNMLMPTVNNTMLKKINLIDTIERLGVSYHFKNEIEEHLQNIFNSKEEIGDDMNLFSVALLFRLLRQHGHMMCSNVFEKFKDNDGNFKKALETDVKGLLSLYEAAHLRINGEEILDEALTFTTAQLKLFAPISTSQLLQKQVEHALVQSLHRGIPRLEARHFISIYEEDESKNEVLLRLAKLDFNLLQIKYKEELFNLSRWWKELNLISKLSDYPRDRLVECYFWSLAMYHEVQYSQARLILTKVLAFLSVIDDTYDAYATLEELEVLTDAFQRWNIDEIDRLPDYMKILYKAVLDLFKNFDEELREDGRSYTVNYTKEAMKQIVSSYFTESKWFIRGSVPRFEEYMSNALITGGNYILVPVSYMGMKSAKNDVFAWVLENPKILQCSAIIGRIIDDVASYEVEKGRGQLATGIECYMIDREVSKEEACEKFHEMAENAWKDMNAECLKPTLMPFDILIRVVNFSRIIDASYKNDHDGYTHPEKVLKQHIISLLVDPIIIH